MALVSDYEYLFKMLVVGDSGVGKSSLVERFSDGKFHRTFVPTIGVDFKIQTVYTKANKKVKLQIWDTAGQDRFKAITASYYRGGNAIVLCYDTTDRSTFEHLRNWLKEIASYAREEVKMILVGTKTDMKKPANKLRRVSSASSASMDSAPTGSSMGFPRSRRSPRDSCAPSYSSAFASAGCPRSAADYADDEWLTEEEDAQALAEELGVPLVRCSAKTGDEVETAFVAMAEELVADRVDAQLLCTKSGMPKHGGAFTLAGAGAGAGAGGGVSGFFSRLCFS